MKPFLSQAEAISRLRQENSMLRAENQRLLGDVDFIAVMAGIDLNIGEEETTDNLFVMELR